MKLNIGCGRNIMEGWINVDSVKLPGVDLVIDLDRDDGSRYFVGAAQIVDNTVDEILCSHVLEHIHSILPLMQELWRVAKNGATMTVRVPYGSSDDADEDPTHVRRFFINSTGYFSAPFYWRADYGFRADWATDQIVLYMARPGLTMDDVHSKRNVVSEMVATLRAIKPARAPLRELQVQPRIILL